MAFDFSKLNFFSKLDAKARVFVLLMVVVGLIVLVYIMTLFFGGDNTLGPSRVATAPSQLQTVPGGTGQSAVFQRSFEEANRQRAEAAKMSGTSALPTQANLGSAGGTGSCIICSDKSANVKNVIQDLVRQGKLTSDIADRLQSMANKNVSVEEYAAELNRLVKEGKITPDQARAMIEEYKKQHTNARLGEAEQVMDELIKSGQMPVDVATQLLDAQKRNVTPAEYNAMLQQMVREGKISAAVAQQLMQQYNKQCIQESVDKHLVLINQMSENGSITKDIATQLVQLTQQNTPAESYSTQINNMVTQGNLTPVAAGSLIDAYQQGKAACGSAGTINELLRQAENAAYQELSDLLSAGKISPETASQLTSLIQSNASTDEFKSAVNQLLQENKLTPQIAQLKIGDYEKVKKLRDAKQQLADAQANNVSPSEYAERLKALVAAGVITPDQAAQLMQEYQTLKSSLPSSVAISPGAFGELQKKVFAGNAGGVPQASAAEFQVAQTQVTQETDQARQARVAAIMAAMSSQAGQLVGTWQTSPMVHREGVSATAEEEGNGSGTEVTVTSGKTETKKGGVIVEVAAPVLIKGGSIHFAVLDTAINSDYPDSPIMATIVEGPYKGAKMMGKIVTTKSVSGQMDRVSLNFTLMNVDAWPKSKTVTAYAIDPDTARTVMASTVDYHYMMRFGAMFATSFLQGYATAFTNQGTSTTGIFGTSTEHPELSPTGKMMVALGQVGQTLGQATQNYVNRPPTVRVDSGVSLGILFMTDVT